MRSPNRGYITLLILLLVFAANSAYAQRKGGGRDTTASGKAGEKNEGKLKHKGGKPLVIVVPSSTSNTYWTQELTEAELETALVQSGRFTTLSRSALEAILKEQRLAQSDLVDPSRAPEVGKLLGADYIILAKCLAAESKQDNVNILGGKFSQKKNKLLVKVQLQLLDVETGEIKDTKDFSDKAEASSSSVSGYGGNDAELAEKDVYTNMMKGFAAEYVDRINQLIPITAVIVQVKGDQVLIDQGENASVREGMEFEVVTDGEPIKNSAGEVLGYDSATHGKIRVVKVEPKFSRCEIVETQDDSGRTDPSPNPARIQRDYTAKQTSSAARRSSVSTSDTNRKEEKKKDEKKDTVKDSLKKKLPF